MIFFFGGMNADLELESTHNARLAEGLQKEFVQVLHKGFHAVAVLQKGFHAAQVLQKGLLLLLYCQCDMKSFQLPINKSRKSIEFGTFS